ncbi:MAG: cobalt-precorrin-5B (C(1))-methyltransferase CbiD [Fusobacteriaceae bacterium]
MSIELKIGYTTGSCSAAATKVALEKLFKNTEYSYVDITSLNDKKIIIPVHSIKLSSNKSCRVSIIKDAGDDPDVTNGIQICSRVRIVEDFKNTEKGFVENNIYIGGGRGVGIVTKKGLLAPIGKYAINPGPLKMIFQVAKEILEELNIKEKKIEIIIFIPEGKKKALSTLNYKLGILGGISILGSTGIVKPMSEEALKASLYVELKVMKENSKKDWAIFVFGNHGERFCKTMGLDKSQIVIISNYIGFMLESAIKLNFKKIILIGHIGKAVKIAGGIFNTHSRVADARLEILSANAVLIGEPLENIKKIMSSNTVDEASEYVEKKELFNLISNKVSLKSQEYSRNQLICEALVFSFSGEILGFSDNFYNLVGECVEKN